MDLPVMPPIKPMLAKSIKWDELERIAVKNLVQLESKWDDFLSS